MANYWEHISKNLDKLHEIETDILRNWQFCQQPSTVFASTAQYTHAMSLIQAELALRRSDDFVERRHQEQMTAQRKYHEAQTASQMKQLRA